MKERIISFDVLRILASFGVVLLHASSQHFYDSFPSDMWIIGNIYHSFLRWCVPVFVMISGALFLNPKKIILTKRLYTSNIFHIICAFIFWSFLYVIYDTGIQELSWNMVSEIIKGPFHFWFLKMLLGLYMAVPIFRIIVSNKRCERYFLFLAFLFSFFVPCMSILVGFFSESGRNLLTEWVESLYLYVIAGYSTYFFLGHYITQYHFNSRLKNWLSLFGICCCICVAFVTYYYSLKKGTPHLPLYDYLSPFAMFEAIGLFIFITDINYQKWPMLVKNCVFMISKYSFGIYLIHILIMKLTYDVTGLDASSCNSLLFIPCYSILIYFISAILIAILYRIPWLKSFIV